MLHILGMLPTKEQFAVACSGGVDSMVLVDFLRKFPNKYKFKLLYFNHGTRHGSEAETFLRDFAQRTGLQIEVGHIEKENPEKGSMEEFWRNERYRFFAQHDVPIAMAHNLTDCVETWLFSSIRGVPKIIPYRNNNAFRPFLMVSKAEILKWAERFDVQFIQDPSNDDTKYTRNLIRHDLMPHVLKVNPGIESMLKSMIRKRGT